MANQNSNKIKETNPVKKKLMNVESKMFKTSELLITYMNKKIAHDSISSSFNRNIKNIMAGIDE